MIIHSFEPDLNQRPMDYKLTLLQSTALSTELSKVDEREWLFISCELLVHNAFVKKKRRWLFTPSSRIWTSDLWITNLLYYSPPLYRLSYRRFDDHEWHLISCELLVHNGFVEKKNYTSFLRAGFEPATYGLQTCFTTVHRSTNWAIEGLTIVSDISFHVNC